MRYTLESSVGAAAVATLGLLRRLLLALFEDLLVSTNERRVGHALLDAVAGHVFLLAALASVVGVIVLPVAEQPHIHHSPMIDALEYP